MQTLKLPKDKLTEAYNQAGNEGKNVLKTLFPDDIPADIKERVKSFEDACSVLGIDPDTIISDFDSKDEIAYKKLKVIIKALNEGWAPDWKDSDQVKYYPWLEYKNNKVFVFDRVNGYYAYSSVGSRLCFKNSKLAEYCVKQFTKLYNEFFN